VMLGPLRPAPLDGADGADEHAVHVEEDAANGDFHVFRVTARPM
jgi:hypothetical protein